MKYGDFTFSTQYLLYLYRLKTKTYMKNILHRTLLLITSLVSTTSLLVSCSSNDDAQQFLSKLDREAEARKQEILSTPTILDQEKLNTIYYI